MRSVIRRHSNLAEIALLILILAVIAILAWGLSASANTQRGRMPPGPKRGVNYKSFNHASHSAKCAQCHKVKEGEREKDFPGHNACNDCHFFPAFAAAQKNYCNVCHVTNNWTRVKAFPEQRDNQFAIKFPHRDHVGMDVKDYNPIVKVSFSPEEEKIQAISIKNGCISCHVKDGKEQKQANFSKPHHAECAQCHGDEGKKVPPTMFQCDGCHIKPMKGEIDISNIVPEFRHDRDHEQDIRPTAKAKAVLDCRFCHNTAVKAKQLVEIKAPESDKCTACHNKEVGVRELTAKELAKLSKPTTPPTTTPATTTKPKTAKPEATKPETAKPPATTPEKVK